jgi:hypothetical protein
MYSPDDRDMPQSPDPVAAPDAYRVEILGWLGHDDPTVVQSGTAEHLRALVRVAGDRLRYRPAPTEWSVVECVGHLVDSEFVLSARMRWIIAEDEPAIVGYDQDRWVDGLGHRDDDPAELITLFVALRTANLRLWRTLSPAAMQRVGVHNERGPESLDLMWRLTAGHDRFHVAQAERALAALRTDPVRQAPASISTPG